MFQNIFSMSPLVWSAWISALVALPILIHLINMLRHQKVPWATMEFLLRSHKRNKNWIRFRQWILLASRILILLLILFMLAQIGCQNDQLARWTGSGTTHHYVLVDDSFSMGESIQGVSAMDRAKETLAHIAARARGRSNQKFTMLRFSKSVSAENDQGDPGSGEFELNSIAVDGNFDARMESVRSELQLSHQAVGPISSLNLVKALAEQRKDNANHVYVLSDFREKDWNDNPEIQDSLQALSRGGARIELIDCSQQDSQNLAITALEPIGCVRVAGVPLMMQVAIRNYSDTVARNVQVSLSTISLSGVDSELARSGEADKAELPTVLIPEIAPGKTESRQFSVFFETANQHAIQARLQDDSLNADNSRWSIVNMETNSPVLMIDDEKRVLSEYLSMAISPQGMTGIQPVVRTKRFLRDAPLSEIKQFDVIYLLDIDRIDESACRKLKQFAEQGGGIAFVVGEKANLSHYNQLMFEEHEIFPVPIDRSIETTNESAIADLSPTDHSLLAAFTKTSQSLLDQVQINQRLAVPRTWWADNEQNVEVIATFRGDASQPLIVEKSLGKGRSIALLTSIGPSWSNWYRNGTFPAAMLLMENHLASGLYESVERHVGDLIRVEVEEPNVSPSATIIAPGELEGRVSWLQPLKPDPGDPGQQLVEVVNVPTGNPVPGIYDVWLSQSSIDQLSRFAINIDPAESDLTRANGSALREELASSNLVFISWSQFQPETTRNASTTLSKVLLVLLLLILLAEQYLAYRASYHPSRGSEQTSTQRSWQPAK